MSNAPYLTLITEVLPIIRRDFTLEDNSILQPYGTNPLLDGEWLQLNSSYHAERKASGEQDTPAWQVFAERGRYDTQAIGKVPLLFIGGYEAETSICDTTGMAVGDSLVVQAVTVGGVAGKRGLAKLGGGAGQHRLFGTVTRLPGGGKVRYFVPASGGAWKTV